MAITKVKSLPVDDSPDTAGIDPTSDAGKVELATRKWAREVSYALRNLTVDITSSVTPVTPSSSSTATPGAPGTAGLNAWSPVFSIVPGFMGFGKVLQVVSWTGGTGTSPASGVYVGSTGFTSDLSQAVNIQGPAGGALGLQYGFVALGSGDTSFVITFTLPFTVAPTIVIGGAMMPSNSGATIFGAVDSSSISLTGATMYLDGPTPDASHIGWWVAFQ